MSQNNKISINGQEVSSRPYEVPQGYFENLRTRLSAIPQAQPAVPETSGNRKRLPIWRPALAFAACAAAVVAFAMLFFNRSDNYDEALTYEQALYADLIPLNMAEYVDYEALCEGSQVSLTDEEIATLLEYDGSSLMYYDYETDY